MQLNVFFHALWMLCGVGAATFATAPATPLLHAGMLTLGFALGLVFATFNGLPDPVWVGGLAALVAMWQLTLPGAAVLALAVAGGLAGL